MIIHAHSIFDGHHTLLNKVIHIDKGIVTKIDTEGFDASLAYVHVTPAFIDLQIYGAGGKLLSVFPEADTIEKIYQYCVAGGAHYFQPTIASQTKEVIYAAIDAVKVYQHNGGKGCIGLHIEGPWLNVVKKGAHDANIIHSPSINEVEDLLAYGKEHISMITLAPEVCDPAIVDLIQEAGIVVSAGHSDASYDVATSFLNHPIRVATHLFNAMSPLQHRAPGLVGAILNHPTAMCSLVADGYHVDFNAIKIAKKIMGDRLFCITDAVTTTSAGPYQHYLSGDKYECNGVLSGSALTQLQGVNNLIDKVGISFEEAIKMCSLYPARVMQNPNITGTIDINKKADILCLDHARNIVQQIVA
jgi:N-acetylglucosamine-6-phosphate deacetylase